MKCIGSRIAIVLLAISPAIWAQNAANRTAVAPTGYTITDLGTLGGSTSMANAINTSGQIAGTSTITGDAASHAYLWSSGTLQDLGTLGGTNSYGNAINSLGQVAGASQTTSNNAQNLYYWASGSGMHDLGVYGIGFAQAEAGIDDHTRVVGGASNNFDGEDAIAWTKSSGYLDLGGVGGRVSMALGIDHAGKSVVGSGTEGGDFTSAAWKWTKASGVHELPKLTLSSISDAFAINDIGHIAGDSDSNNSFLVHAILWVRGSAPQDLGTLGGSTSSARAINVSDVIVGSSLPTTGTTTHAFVWTSTGGMLDLNNLIPSGSGWVLQVANGVNDSGQIVGNGTIGGKTHGFLLTPAN